MPAASSVRGNRARAEILGAARGVLLERGVARFSLREVARRAEYSPSALYNHFADKDALVAAVAMECLGALSRSLSTVPPGPAPQRLLDLGLAYASFAAENPAEYAVIFDCLTSPVGEWNHYVAIADPFTLIVATCEQGVVEGSLADDAGVGAAGLAYGLWCLVDGHVHLRGKHLAAVCGPFDVLFAAAIRGYVRGLTEKGTSR